MKHYTSEEYQQLISTLRVIKSPARYKTFAIHINGPEYMIGEYALFNYVFNANKTNQRNNSTIVKFLHSTTLRRVPLYMNKLPELCQWRLKIGK